MRRRVRATMCFCSLLHYHKGLSETNDKHVTYLNIRTVCKMQTTLRQQLTKVKESQTNMTEGCGLHHSLLMWLMLHWGDRTHHQDEANGTQMSCTQWRTKQWHCTTHDRDEPLSPMGMHCCYHKDRTIHHEKVQGDFHHLRDE